MDKEKQLKSKLLKKDKEALVELLLQKIFDSDVAEQQLEKKDEQIKKRVMVYEKQFIEQTDEIYSLKQQLAEAEEYIENDEVTKREYYQKTDEIIAEKDKEIEKLKQQYTILENENGKLAKELIVKNYKKAQKEVSFGIQLAIHELEKVKENLKQLEINIDNQAGFSQDYKLELKQKSLYKNVYKIIDQQIKELKGE